MNDDNAYGFLESGGGPVRRENGLYYVEVGDVDFETEVMIAQAIEGERIYIEDDCYEVVYNNQAPYVLDKVRDYD